MPDVIGGLSGPDVAAIQAGSAKYVSTALARDFDRWMTVSADDAVFMPPNAAPLDTRGKIRAWIEGFPKMSSFRLTQIEVAGRADLAYVWGRYEYGADGASDRGKYIEIWKKQADGSWKIFRDIWNSDAAA